MDHHVHFLATAAARLSVDLTRARSVADVAAALAPAGRGWRRGWGYDESELVERRHPTRHDLDRTNRAQPVVVHHRAGHVAVLNSVAGRELGLNGDDLGDGILVDRHDLLARVPRLETAEMSGAATAISREWARAGVVAFTDATHTNGPAELELLAHWRASGAVTQEISAMVSVESLGDVPPYGDHVGAVTVAHAKVMPKAAEWVGAVGGSGSVGGSGLVGGVASAHAAGYPVAVHAATVEELALTIEAMEGSPPPPGTRDRVEHAALCLPEQVARLAACQPVVVVNPSFLLYRVAKYREALSPVEWPWLVRMRSFVAAGLTVRAGSDSPVTPARPVETLAAAQAHPLSPDESLDEASAAGLVTPLR